MKKLLKVKIKRDRSGGKTSYTYPKEYDAQKFDVLVYESQLSEKLQLVLDRDGNDNYEYVLGFVEEKFVPSFLVSKDIVELDKDEAELFIGDTDLNKYSTKVTDQNKVLELLSKQALGGILSDEDRKVLDVNHPTPGINRSKSLKEVLDEKGF